MAATINDFVDRASGITIELPAGSKAGSFYNQKTGKYEDVFLWETRYVTIYIDGGALWSLAMDAVRNRTQTAKDGPLTLRARKVGA